LFSRNTLDVGGLLQQPDLLAQHPVLLDERGAGPLEVGNLSVQDMDTVRGTANGHQENDDQYAGSGKANGPHQP
jgi:hypothetical protein